MTWQEELEKGKEMGSFSPTLLPWFGRGTRSYEALIIFQCLNSCKIQHPKENVTSTPPSKEPPHDTKPMPTPIA